MAACQSSPPCAPLGLLLLLIGVISFHLPEVRARPIDFWCNNQVRKYMKAQIEGLKNDMIDCVGSDKISPVQLPCVWIHKADWENKTLQQNHAEVVGALQVFRDGVQGVNRTTLQCQTSLLERLGDRMANYLVIANNLQLQNDTVTPSHSAVQNCSSQTSLNKVLEQYLRLLNGQLDFLATDLKKSIC